MNHETRIDQGAGDFSLSLPPALVEAIASQVAARLSKNVDTPATEPYLSRDQAAEYLACKPKRISELTERGALRFVEDGTRKLYRASWLDEYLSDPQG